MLGIVLPSNQALRVKKRRLPDSSLDKRLEESQQAIKEGFV